MIKNLLSLVLLATIAISASPVFSACTTTQQKADNKQFYSDKDNQDCCCTKQGTSTTYVCDIVAKNACMSGTGVIKLSGPDYCPCEFVKASN